MPDRGTICRTLVRVALLVALLLTAGSRLQGQVGATPVDAVGLGTSPTVYLNTWRFHMGDAAEWSEPNFDDSQWPVVTTDKTLAEQGFTKFPSMCWYRVRVAVPTHTELSLFLGNVIVGYEAFVDGQRVGAFGGMPGERSYSPTASAYPIPVRGDRLGQDGARTVVIAVRVWAHPETTPPGIRPNASYLGHSADIANLRSLYLVTRFRREAQTIVDAGVYLFVAIVLLAVYLNQRSQREWLWLALGLALVFVSLATQVLLNFCKVPLEFSRDFVITFVYISALACMLQFTLLFVGIRSNRWTWLAVVGLFVAAPVLGLGSYLGVFSVGTERLISAFLSTAYAVVTLGLLGRWWYRGNGEAGILLLPSAIFNANTIGFSLGYAAFSLHLQHARTPHSLLPIFTLPGGAFNTDFLSDLVYVLAILLILLRRLVMSTRQSERLGAEIAAARTVQQILIPEVMPSVPGLKIESAYVPAQEVGGDFFQIIPVADGATLVVLGDVSGKGLQAAMTVSLLVGAMRTLVESSLRPAEILQGLNRRMHGRGPGFATCLVLLIPAKGDCRIANAGHLNPYLNGVEWETETNLPLGLTLEVVYEETEFPLEAARQLTLITDGVLEAMNPAKELFGFDRSQGVSRESAHTIAEAARAFGQNDDITVLTVTRLTAAEVSTTQLAAPTMVIA